MSDLNIQSLQAEDVSAEELQLQKAQQVIDELFMAAESDQRLFEQLEAAISPEKLLEIAASQGYELTVADLERLQDYDQEAAQSSSDDLDDDELSEQELELVAGGCGISPRDLRALRARCAFRVLTKNYNYKKCRASHR
ncbi:Nif11-like leader peptide family natural product precursor [Coleofasciculus sp. F4-SAH-05]|uniref:Nif11-like leader peptide family natural product precursor n=1 Tax=Coleofasciculus sp. F4-SAH-05 TaxID=3069525 RepID=UPI003300AFF5